VTTQARTLLTPLLVLMFVPKVMYTFLNMEYVFFVSTALGMISITHVINLSLFNSSIFDFKLTPVGIQISNVVVNQHSTEIA